MSVHDFTQTKHLKRHISLCCRNLWSNRGHYSLTNLFSTGSHSTSVNWVIKYFYMAPHTGECSRINTVITGHSWDVEGQARSTGFCWTLKYFITSKWKIVHPILTCLRVIQTGFRVQCWDYKQGWVSLILFHWIYTIFMSLCCSTIIKGRCHSLSEQRGYLKIREMFI